MTRHRHRALHSRIFWKTYTRVVRRSVIGIMIMLLFAAAGAAIIRAHASTAAASQEAETGARAGVASTCSDSAASNSQLVRFGSTSCVTTPIPAGQLIGWNDVVNGPGGAWHRMLKLPDGTWLRVLTIFPAAGRSELAVYRSTDNARTWTYLSGANDGNRLVDNGFLYQAPNGDLLMSGRNLINGSSYKISQWRSTNLGGTWTREADIKSVNTNGPGLWEPFYGTVGTKTVVIWSDETYGGYSQVLVQRVSSDNGKTWGGEQVIVSDGGAGRPGMATVAKMANGQYIMTFEVCGTQGCRVFNKKSNDGLSWPGGIGSQIPSATCGPYVTALTDGRVVVTACRVSDSDYRTPIEFSDDNGASWKTNTPAFTNAGQFGNWPAVYQVGPDEIMAVSGSAIRFGTIPR